MTRCEERGREGRKKEENKPENETFRRISLPLVMVNSISLPFSRGLRLDPMGTDRKFAVSFVRSVISYRFIYAIRRRRLVHGGVAPVRRIGGRFYAPGIDSQKRNETKGNREGREKRGNGKGAVLDDRLKEMIEKELIPIFKRNTVSHPFRFDEIPPVKKISFESMVAKVTVELVGRAPEARAPR